MMLTISEISSKSSGLLFIFISLIGMAGCSFWQSRDTESQVKGPVANQQPVVVNGIRVSYADVVEKTSPAVVQIEAEIPSSVSQNQFPFGGDEFFKRLFPEDDGEHRAQRGSGSGVLVGADGTILTNHHVIDGATKILVKLQTGKTLEAKVVGSDAPSDLAVLKVVGDNFPFSS